MKLPLPLLTTLTLSLIGLSQQPVSFRDAEGRDHAPLADKKPTALIFITTDCPISNSYAPEINRIVADYSEKGVAFFLVHTDASLKAADAKKHAADFGFRCPVLLDPHHELVKQTGATITPEVVVFDAADKRAYRGRIDDLYAELGKRRAQATTRELRDALDAVLDGKPVAQPTTRAVGCFIPAHK